MRKNIYVRPLTIGVVRTTNLHQFVYDDKEVFANEFKNPIYLNDNYILNS